MPTDMAYRDGTTDGPGCTGCLILVLWIVGTFAFIVWDNFFNPNRTDFFP